MKQLPRQLKRNKGLACAGGQSQQNTLLACRHRCQHLLYGHVLVIPTLKEPALVLKRHSGKKVAPSVLSRKGQTPQRIRRGVTVYRPLNGCVHVDAINALPIGGKGMAHRQAGCVVLGLGHTFAQSFVPRLGFHYSQLGVAVLQHIVGAQCLAAFACTFKPPHGDGVFAPYAAAVHHAPACSGEGWVNVFGAGFGFVHDALSKLLISSPPASSWRFQFA